MHLVVRFRYVLALVLVTAIASIAHARQGEPPYSLAHPAKVGVNVPIEDVKAVDAAARRARADADARHAGAQTKRLQVADDNRVSITPERGGRWDTLPDGSRLWRMRVRAAGATDLRLGFDRFALPAGATVYVIGADDYYQGPYAAADATPDGFHSPVVPGDTATIELRVPAGVELADDALELDSVGAGFRDVFGRKVGGGLGQSGACNIDVACPLGQPYPDEIRAVGHYEFRADADRRYYICTGTLLADVPRTRKNWFLTAAHCLSSATEATTMVIYWNYQSTQCGRLVGPAGGFFNDNQSGAALRASRADVDFTLVELNATPNPSWKVYYAGWDATDARPNGTIGIHHPSGDVKKITAGPLPERTSSCIASSPSSTHWLAGPYTQGTTEGGSSGSGLFVVAGNGSGDRRLIGMLSGGNAQCSSLSPNQPNSGYDCYGRFAIAWNGPAATARLRDWLDPAGTGATGAAGIDSQATTPPPTPLLRHSTRPVPLILRHERRR